MSRSLWSILILGILTALLLTLGMLFTLDQFQQFPAGNRVKFAETIRTEFQFDSAGADVSPVDGKMVLRISCMTTKDSKHDQTAQRQEMERVAAFAAVKYDGKDKSTIQEIQIRRAEVRGKGCFQKTYHNHHTAAPPPEWKSRPGLPTFLQQPPPQRNP